MSATLPKKPNRYRKLTTLNCQGGAKKGGPTYPSCLKILKLISLNIKYKTIPQLLSAKLDFALLSNIKMQKM